MYSLELHIGATYECQRSAEDELEKLEDTIKRMAQEEGFDEVAVEVNSRMNGDPHESAEWHYVAGDSDG